MDNRPIGMFDSGIGGITVLKEYQKIMPNENYIYYADTKHLPYGDKTKEEIISYAKNIVEYFISKNVKAIIIACGTASSLAYEILKKEYDIPIFDIITPVVQEITSKNIGVIATQGSINSGVWEKRLLENDSDRNVYSVACPKLVPLAEKGLNNSLIAKYYIKKYTKIFKTNHIDSLVLGCTHYPLFKNLIKKELENQIDLINIGTLSAEFFNKYLLDNSLATSSTQGNVTYIVSGDEQIFLKKIKNFTY